LSNLSLSCKQSLPWIFQAGGPAAPPARTPLVLGDFWTLYRWWFLLRYFPVASRLQVTGIFMLGLSRAQQSSCCAFVVRNVQDNFWRHKSWRGSASKGWSPNDPVSADLPLLRPLHVFWLSQHRLRFEGYRLCFHGRSTWPLMLMSMKRRLYQTPDVGE